MRVLNTHECSLKRTAAEWGTGGVAGEVEKRTGVNGINLSVNKGALALSVGFGETKHMSCTNVKLLSWRKNLEKQRYVTI